MNFVKSLPILALLITCTGCGFLNRNQYCTNGSTSCGSSSDLSSSASAPITNGALSVANKTREGLTINWPSATDATTPQSNLTYQLVYSENVNDLNTVAKALNMIQLGYGMPLRQANTSETLSQLQVGHSYYFTVVVTNQNGYSSIYPPQFVQFTDDVPPDVIQKLYATNLGPTSISLVWSAATDNGTPQAQLQYRVVGSLHESDFASPTIAAALTGSAIKQDWTTNITSTTIVGLTPSVPMFVAVLVKDAAGNISMMGPTLTETLDISAPTVGTFYSPDVTATTVNVGWTPATDDVSASANIAYRVVASTNLSDVDTISKAQNATGSILINDWQLNLQSASITGLSSGATVYITVIVRDEAGNPAIYGPLAVQTSDNIAPVVPSALAFSFVGTNQLTVYWRQATDNVTPQPLLQYRVVYATSSQAISTPGRIAAMTGPQVAFDWGTNPGKALITGLNAYTQYYVAIAVRDAAGNMSLYSPQSVRTIDQSAPLPSQIFGLQATTAGDGSYNVTWSRTKDNEVDQTQISYRLVYSTNLTDVSTVDRASSYIGAGLVMDWTLDTQSATATLPSSSVLYFVVLAKDLSGNTSSSQILKFATPDTTPPTVGGAITSALGSSSRWWTISWPAGTDDVTTQTNLNYFTAISTDPTTINTVALALAQFTTPISVNSPCFIEGNQFSTKLMTYAYGSGTQDCYASVLVRDEAGNMSLYPPVKVYTYVAAVPSPKFTREITAAPSGTSALVTWGPAIAGDTSSVSYRLVISSSASSINSISQVDGATSGVIQDYNSPAGTKQYASNLTPGTTYYFSVVAKAGSLETLSGPTSVVMPTNPTAGPAITVGAISQFQGLVGNFYSLSWGAATDVVTSAGSLQYTLVFAHDPNAINSAAKIAACTAPCVRVQDWTANYLSSNSAYVYANQDNWFAVGVRNSSLLASAYAPVRIIGPTMPVTLDPAGINYYIGYTYPQGPLYTKRLNNSTSNLDTGKIGTNVDAYQTQYKLMSDGNLYVLVQEVSCPTDAPWVRTTQIYRSFGIIVINSWAPISGIPQGSYTHCTNNGVVYSSTYRPSMFEIANDIGVVQNESRGGTYVGTLRTNNRFNSLSSWGESVVNLPSVDSIASTFTSGSTAYVFFDSGTTPKIYAVTADTSEPANLTATDLNFDVTVASGQQVGEPGGQALTRMAKDSSGNLYAIYIDPGNGSQARVRRFNGTAWADTGLTSAGAAGEVSLLYANNKLYALYIDYASGIHGMDAVLKSYNGTSWTTLSSAIFGTDVITPLMRLNPSTQKVDVTAITASLRRLTTSF